MIQSLKITRLQQNLQVQVKELLCFFPLIDHLSNSFGDIIPKETTVWWLSSGEEITVSEQEILIICSGMVELVQEDNVRLPLKAPNIIGDNKLFSLGGGEKISVRAIGDDEALVFAISLASFSPQAVETSPDQRSSPQDIEPIFEKQTLFFHSVFDRLQQELAKGEKKQQLLLEKIFSGIYVININHITKLLEKGEELQFAEKSWKEIRNFLQNSLEITFNPEEPKFLPLLREKLKQKIGEIYTLNDFKKKEDYLCQTVQTFHIWLHELSRVLIQTFEVDALPYKFKGETALISPEQFTSQISHDLWNKENELLSPIPGAPEKTSMDNMSFTSLKQGKVVFDLSSYAQRLPQHYASENLKKNTMNLSLTAVLTAKQFDRNHKKVIATLKKTYDLIVSKIQKGMPSVEQPPPKYSFSSAILKELWHFQKKHLRTTHSELFSPQSTRTLSQSLIKLDDFLRWIDTTKKTVDGKNVLLLFLSKIKVFSSFLDQNNALENIFLFLLTPGNRIPSHALQQGLWLPLNKQAELFCSMGKLMDIPQGMVFGGDWLRIFERENEKATLFLTCRKTTAFAFIPHPIFPWQSKEALSLQQSSSTELRIRRIMDHAISKKLEVLNRLREGNNLLREHSSIAEENHFLHQEIEKFETGSKSLDNEQADSLSDLLQANQLPPLSEKDRYLASSELLFSLRQLISSNIAIAEQLEDKMAQEENRLKRAYYFWKKIIFDFVLLHSKISEKERARLTVCDTPVDILLNSKLNRIFSTYVSAKAGEKIVKIKTFSSKVRIMHILNETPHVSLTKTIKIFGFVEQAINSVIQLLLEEMIQHKKNIVGFKVKEERSNEFPEDKFKKKLEVVMPLIKKSLGQQVNLS